MNIKRQRCGRHPSHPLVGVCALCLTERLSIVESKGWGTSSTSKDLHEASLNHHQNFSNTNGLEATEHDRHNLPSAQRPNGSTFDNQGEVEIGSKKESAEKILDSKSEVMDSAENIRVSKSGEIDSLDKILGSRCRETDLILEPKSGEEAPTEVVEHGRRSICNQSQICSDHSLPSLVEKTKPMISMELKGPMYSDISLCPINLINENTASMVSVELKTSFSASIDGTTGSLPSIQIPATTVNSNKLDYNQEEGRFESGEKDSIEKGKHGSAKESLFKDSQIGSESSIAPTNEKIKSMLSSELNEPVTASIGNNKNICRSSGGNVTLNIEPQMDTNKLMEVMRAPVSRSASSHKHKKNTLSSLFILDDKGQTNEEHVKAIRTSAVIAKALSSSVSEQCKTNLTHEQRRYQNRSFSERADPTKYLFPVPETTKKDSSSSVSSSWFSSLFRKWRKSPLGKSAAINTSSNKTHQTGWVHGRQSWDAPRPSSSWGLFSFDRPRSSWEPSRPSWDGVIRASDGDSVLNGIDFYTEGLREVTRVSEGLRERGIDGRRLLESTKTGSKFMSKAPPHSDDRVKSSKPKHTLAHTTPPRSSEAIEVYIQQRFSNDQYQHHRQYSRSSHALWSKVWTKTFSNPKWAFKTKLNKGQVVKEEGKTIIMTRDDAHDRGKTKLSPHELAKENSHNGGHLRNFNNNVERETRWNAYYGPILKKSNDEAINDLKVVHPQKDLVSKNNIPNKKDELENKNRGSSFMLENGLLSFYLTPVRKGHGRGKGIMMV